jgi:carboxymethylenebutenolidase
LLPFEGTVTDLITNMIQYASSSGETTSGYLARPTYAGPHRGVLLVQDWWGLVPHIEEVARRLARSGFVALAPDLYQGQKADNPEEARQLAESLDQKRAMADIAGAARYLKGLDQVAPKWVGIIGWGLGGGLAISASAYSGDFAAVVTYYGRPMNDADIPRIQAPLLGLYGETDDSIPPQWVRDFDQQLSDNYLTHENVTYPGAGHGFFNDTQQESYHEASARDAWDRTLAWLRNHLG